MNWKQVLSTMKPYKPGRSIDEVKRVYGLQEVVKLASNENPYGSSPSVKEYLAKSPLQYEIYPDGFASGLREELADMHGVSVDNLLFGNGSDEIITIISRSLLDEGTNTVMATPTFPQYAHNAKIEGAEVREIPLKDGHHDLDEFLRVTDESTAVIWVCNPNNPTGNLIPSDALQAFLDKVPQDILVVLDEAYFEYITEPTHIDSINWLSKYPNIIILRTFSKAYGLASFRIGYGIASPEIIAELNKVRNPFNNSVLAVAVAKIAVEDKTFLEKCRTLNHEQRERVKLYANENNLHVYNSETNFVLIQVPNDADEATEKLLQEGFIVRSGNALGTPGYVRVTIGTQEQMTGFFKAFDKLINEGR